MQDQPIAKKKRLPTGLSEMHSRRCRRNEGGSCNCTPAIRAFVYNRRTHNQVRQTFSGKGALAAAKAWRADATSQMYRGKRIGPSAMTLDQAAEAWLAGAEADPPTVLTRGGKPYKPSVLREYRRTLKTYVLDDLGAQRLSDIRRGDLQALIDRLIGEGLSGGTVRNVIMPIRVLYRHALERDDVAVNPTANLRLPNGHTPRDRAASATEAAALLAALPADVRPIYAVAFYAGLRRGELRGLRWDDVDLATGIIHVRRGWDDVAGEIAPKSATGTRTIPITTLLREQLVELKAASRGIANDFVFASKHRLPFTPSNIRKHAAEAWAAENLRRAQKNLPPLVPIALHEARHTFVSLMHEAGFSLEEIAPYAGHSSTYMTDRYKHLIVGHEARAAARFDAYLALADTAARVDQLGGSTS
jgi:integrase